MRLFITLILFGIYLQTVSAQVIKKNYVGFCIGPAFPIGAYANKDSLSKEAGLARAGYTVEVYVGLSQGKYWGICTSLKGIYNGIDNDDLRANYRQNGLASENWNPRAKDPWSIGSFQVGAFGSIPVGTSNSLFIEPKLMIGVSNCSTPTMQLDHKGVTNTTRSNVAGSFCYSTGILVRYNLSPKIVLLVDADYFTTKPAFNDLYIAGGIQRDGTQKITTLNISAGIGIRITREK